MGVLDGSAGQKTLLAELGAAFGFEEVGELELEGFREPQRVFRLHGPG
ncbi:MAG: hypothetical protein KatS3mg076_2762 [Candidatus Binatia bacterium]|nr:MAG: hypothetical protein KatS3mg076_2762 [Candidatus Binatia bacterium]